MPVDFISVAEDTGLILPIGRWVLLEACQTMQSWRKQFSLGSDIQVSVNLSGYQINQPGLVAAVEEALASSDLPPRCLSLEVTESSLIDNVAAAISTLKDVKALGVSLQLDDFGTGYSSLSYLRQFPIDVLKIDRSFIRKGSGSLATPNLVRTIVMMGQDLGLDVVAEGIETPAQVEWLKRIGCTHGQGYYFSKPMDVPGAQQYLSQRMGRMPANFFGGSLP
jgi:EAL domain-containing protein (putative c-di-GMP-specific phosphodiesterase class I)